MFRPDWEKVIGPVVDYLFLRPEVDRARIALMGVSFGGYLAPRAASFETRIAALIADPGELSLFEEMKRRLPPFAVRRLMDREGLVPRILEFALSRRLRHVSQGWALRRGLLVHGLKTPIDYLRLTADYATERPEAIGCPTSSVRPRTTNSARPRAICTTGSSAARPFWPSRRPRGPVNIANPARAHGSTSASSTGSTRGLPRSPRRARSAGAEILFEDLRRPAVRSTCMPLIPVDDAKIWHGKRDVL